MKTATCTTPARSCSAFAPIRDPERDSTIIRNPSDSLDHAPTWQNIGSHMGLDATRKLPGEGYHRGWPELVKMSEEAQRLVDTLIRQT